MKSNILFILILSIFTVTFSALPTLAADKNFYVAGGVGWFSPENLSLDDSTISEDREHFVSRKNYRFSYEGIREFSGMEAILKDSFSPIGAVGMYLGERFRVELEYAYRNSSMTSIHGSAKSYSISEPPCAYYLCPDNHNELLEDAALYLDINESVDKNVESHSFMANAYFDHPMSDKLTGYVGFGIGAALINYNISVETEYSDAIPYLIADPEFRESGGPTQYNVDYNSTRFAYQLMAGVSYELNDSFSLTGGYRFFGIENSVSANGIEAGIRFNF